MMRSQIAVRAVRMFRYEPRMWIFWSASTTRVLVQFSTVNLTLPPLPAMRPIARARWSPLSGFTTRTRKTRKKRGQRRENKKERKKEKKQTVTNVKAIDVKIVEAEKRNGIFHVEAEAKSPDEISGLLQRPRVCGQIAGLRPPPRTRKDRQTERKRKRERTREREREKERKKDGEKNNQQMKR